MRDNANIKYIIQRRFEDRAILFDSSEDGVIPYFSTRMGAISAAQLVCIAKNWTGSAYRIRTEQVKKLPNKKNKKL